MGGATDGLGMAAVLTVLVLLFAGLHRWQGRLSGELSRKIVHGVMGLVALSFPWLFTQAWPVVVLAGLSTVLLVAVKQVPALQQRLGGVLGGVSRDSWGEVYFPLSVGLVFVLANGNAVLYGIPVAILTLADALSALVGVRYGQQTYATSEGTKTLEGSLAFFIMAFAVTHITLLLAAPVGRLESLLIGAIVGLLVMLIEAIAWRGQDNVWIPLATLAFLQAYLPLPAEVLWPRLLVLVSLLPLMVAWRKRLNLKACAVIASFLVAYAAANLGGWLWLLPVLTVFFAAPWLLPKPVEPKPAWGLRAVVATAGSALVWLLLAQALPFMQQVWLWPFATALACHLAMMQVAAHLAQQPIERPSVAVWLWPVIRAATWAWLLVLLPLALLAPPGEMGFWSIALLWPAVGLTTAWFVRQQPHLQAHEQDLGRWVHRGVVALAGSSLAIGLWAWAYKPDPLLWLPFFGTTLV